IERACRQAYLTHRATNGRPYPSVAAGYSHRVRADTGATDRLQPGECRIRGAIGLSSPWRDGQRQDAGVYPTDRTGDPAGQTGALSASGDRADGADHSPAATTFRRLYRHLSFKIQPERTAGDLEQDPDR